VFENVDRIKTALVPLEPIVPIDDRVVVTDVVAPTAPSDPTVMDWTPLKVSAKATTQRSLTQLDARPLKKGPAKDSPS
jgi:hypothetical protein